MKHKFCNWTDIKFALVLPTPAHCGSFIGLQLLLLCSVVVRSHSCYAFFVGCFRAKSMFLIVSFEPTQHKKLSMLLQQSPLLKVSSELLCKKVTLICLYRCCYSLYLLNEVCNYTAFCTIKFCSRLRANCMWIAIDIMIWLCCQLSSGNTVLLAQLSSLLFVVIRTSLCWCNIMKLNDGMFTLAPHCNFWMFPEMLY